MTARILAVAAAGFLAFSAAQAASDQGLASSILECSALQGDQAQLACFRQIAAQLKANPSTAAAAQAAPTQAPAAGAQPQTAAAQAQEKKDGAWYDVGGLFGSSKEKEAETPRPHRRVIGTPADFGKEGMAFDTSGPVMLDHITVGVSKVSYNFFKHFTVTLDNGQVWQQKNSDTAVARFSKDKKDTVTIKRGFLGAFILSIDGRWGVFRVKRIK